MIRFSHVSKRYPGGNDALKSISFHLERGSMNFLTGHSGAGKSSLLKLITHSILATRGEIMVNHEVVAEELEAAVALFGVELSFHGVDGFYYN